MAFEGLDPEVLRGVQHQLSGQVSRVNAICGHVDGIVRHALHVWEGPHASDFHAAWVSAHRPRLIAVAEVLDAMAALLGQEIQQQVVASGGTGAQAAPASQKPYGRDHYLFKLAGASEAMTSDPPQKADLPQGWLAASPADLAKLGLSEADLRDRANGLDAVLYTDGHGHYVLAFAGSKGSMSPLSPSADWQQNYAAGFVDPTLPVRSAQVEAAASLAYEISHRVGAQNLTLTGHSLGGRDAAVASMATGSRAVTFNAEGVTPEDAVYANTLSGRGESLGGYVWSRVTGSPDLSSAQQHNIVSYTTQSDPLSNLEQNGLGPHQVGQPQVVPGTTDDPLKAHSLSSFGDEV